MKRIRVVGLLIAVGLVATGELRAQPAPTAQSSARVYLQSGVEHYGAGRYAEAAAAFREAHAITHRPELLFNLGMSLERAGDLPGALEAYTLFASAGSPGDDPDRMQARIADLRARQAAAQSSAEARARRGQDATPPPAPAAPAPSPEVRTTLITERVEVRYERSTLQSAGPWVLLGVGAALALTGSLVGFGANQVATDVAAANRGEQAWSADLNGRYIGHGSAVGAAYAVGFVGVAAMVGGGLWLALRGPGTRREVSLGPLGALPLPGGGGMLTVGGRL